MLRDLENSLQEIEPKINLEQSKFEWAHGHKLASRARQLTDDQKEAFYAVNKFVKLAHEDYRDWALEVDECPSSKGQWRETLKLSESAPVDLEIGTGNGYFFEHRARTDKGRGLIGIELKYKPLVQTIKRTLYTGHKHFRLLRYDAYYLKDLFSPNELNDVFIFFPDPWEKRKENKNRIVDVEFLSRLHEIQRPGSRLFFKTDSEGYFNWVCDRIGKSPYEVMAVEKDLYNSKWKQEKLRNSL